MNSVQLHQRHSEHLKLHRLQSEFLFYFLLEFERVLQLSVSKSDKNFAVVFFFSEAVINYFLFSPIYFMDCQN